MKNKIVIRQMSIGIILVIIILFSGCSEPEIFISESRKWETGEEEAVLKIIEDMNFTKEFPFFRINQSYLGLPFTLPYSNRTFTVPNPPLQYIVWDSYYVDAARAMEKPWDRKSTISGGDITCSYRAFVKTHENISFNDFSLRISLAIKFYFIFNETTQSFAFLIPKSRIDVLSNLKNDTFTGYEVTQVFSFSYGFLAIDTIQYEQTFFFNKSNYLRYGFINYFWATTN